MPININYSRKIAKLLKVIGCDKGKNWLKGEEKRRRNFFFLPSSDEKLSLACFLTNFPTKPTSAAATTFSSSSQVSRLLRSDANHSTPLLVSVGIDEKTFSIVSFHVERHFSLPPLLLILLSFFPREQTL